MRVIAGKYKGRKLNSPEDSTVRPTTDKVKEALFSILTNELYGARVLDLIRSNLAHCAVEEKTRVAAGDYAKILRNLTRRVEEGLEEPFDIILLDPPYDAGLLDNAFRLIAEGRLLADDGLIVAEHRKQEELPEELHGFIRSKERRYGVVKLSIYNNM